MARHNEYFDLNSIKLSIVGSLEMVICTLEHDITENNWYDMTLLPWLQTKKNTM